MGGLELAALPLANVGETDRKTTEGAARSARGFWVVGQQSSNIKPQRQQKYTSTNIVGSQQRDGGRRTGGAGERGLPSIGALSSINCVALHLKTKNLIFPIVTYGKMCLQQMFGCHLQKKREKPAVQSIKYKRT